MKARIWFRLALARLFIQRSSSKQVHLNPSSKIGPVKSGQKSDQKSSKKIQNSLQSFFTPKLQNWSKNYADGQIIRLNLHSFGQRISVLISPRLVKKNFSMKRDGSLYAGFHRTMRDTKSFYLFYICKHVCRSLYLHPE